MKYLKICAFLLCFAFVFVFFKFDAKKDIKNNEVLKIALPNDIRSLDPALSFEKNTSHVINMIFEGLMRRGANDAIEFAVAESVEISEDKKHYIFHLRDCKWSDGTPITAYDFEFSWKRLLDPNCKPLLETPYYFYPIKNAKLCLLGQVSVSDVPINAIDDKTLSVELEHPSFHFLDIVSLPYFFPIPKHFMENDSNWGSQDNIVCNGPFRLESWRKKNKIEVKKNPMYWDQSNVYLDGIDISIIENLNTAYLLYEKKKLDWVGDPFCRLPYDISFGKLDHEKESAQIHWFFINTEKYPLNNKKLRKALSYSIDRQAIVEGVFYNAASPATSVLAPSFSVRAEKCFEDNNTMVAKALFDEALQELGISAKQLPEIEVRSVCDLELHHRVVQSIQDQWRKVLGIKNSASKQAEWVVHYDSISHGDYELGLMGWCISVSDGMFLLDAFKNKDESHNKSCWENAQYKELLEQATFTEDEDRRIKLLREAEDILMDEMPVIPLCFPKQRYAKNPKLKGENLSIFHFIDFKSAYFE